ncbi:MAG TPA: DNA mismatch repair protein MutS, partial [Dehalococcoidia bacterium]|nr:DNA mismatch repair protein MutS [Dehalococcoidia bacterium]
MQKPGPTPIRRQYLGIKKQYPQAIVLFRLGDFYETFDEDARTIARELEIVLTSREMGKGNRVPLAGIPYHALDNYLAKLVNRGYKVAICEQVTRPGETRGIVEREVVRVVTPGTIVEPGLLDSKANNYLTSVALNDKEAGIAYVDITTSEFATTQLPLRRITPELERLRPSELITNARIELSGLEPGIHITPVDEFWFELEKSRQTLLEHFGVKTLYGFGCDRLPLAIKAAGAIVRYLQETQKGALGQLTHLSTYSTDSFMALDTQTQNNLELFRSATGVKAGSLLSVIDLTSTSMGGRLLKRWLSQPLFDIDQLVKRQDSVAWFHKNALPRNQVITLLKRISDLERLINRIGSNIANPHELVALRRSLEVVPELRETIDSGDNENGITWLEKGLIPCDDVVTLIGNAVADEPSGAPGEGNIIRPGYSEELDSLKEISHNARQYLANLEREEQEKTGIKSLKIGYNRVFGYYIEISKSSLSQVPEHYIRKQTLVNGERYFTPELKEHESTILNARERITELERSIFQTICAQVAEKYKAILDVARTIALVDV